MSLSRFLQPKKCSIFVHLIRKHSFYNPNILSTYLKQKKPSVSFSKYRKSSSGLRDVKHSSDEKAPDFDVDLHEFNSAYELVEKAILHTNDKALMDVVSWNAKAVDYNSQDARKRYGVAVLKSFKALTEEDSPDISSACILGWCVQMFLGCLNIIDDIMDESTSRGGRPCWHTLPNVGSIAFNDSFLLECSVFKVLETYFKNRDIYPNLVQEFLEANRDTVYGQAIDMLNISSGMRPWFENFSMEKYDDYAKYKSFPFFLLIVRLSMHLTGNFSKNDFESIRDITFKLALLTQTKNDSFDLFEDLSIYGKERNDIKNGKFTWFATYVFENGTKSMKKIMIENYGQDNQDSVSKVTNLYNEIGIGDKFQEYRQSLTNEIAVMADRFQKKPLQRLFNTMLKTYK